MTNEEKNGRSVSPLSRISSRFALFISGVTIGASLITVLIGYLIITFDVLRFPKESGVFPTLLTLLITSAVLVIFFSCLFGRGVFKSVLSIGNNIVV